MERHPIKAVTILTYRHFLPFLPDQVEKIEAFAYRFPIPQTPFKMGVDPETVIKPEDKPTVPEIPPWYEEPKKEPWQCDPRKVIADDYSDTSGVFAPKNAATASGECQKIKIR